MDRDDILAIYRRRARTYDRDVKWFNLVGWRVNRYRVAAIEALHLKRGDTVIDLGCNTGLNFPHLFERVGADGSIIGVDLTNAMLREAKQRVKENRWTNVSLVNSDAALYQVPPAQGIISSYALTLSPEYDGIVERGAAVLASGGRFVVLDFKKPAGWPDWLAKALLRAFIKPYGGSYEMKDRHAWESLGRHLKLVVFEEYYFGTTYVAAGEK